MTLPSVEPVGVKALADDFIKLLVRSERKASGIEELSEFFLTPDLQLRDIMHKHHGTNRHDSACSYSLE